ncbi:hemerythrin family protein [Campylobacter sp. LMG 7929]|uniref:Hemerythrin family protein n=1 Tax=Campylobacter lari TaxID=201 RepID=A0A7M1MKB8_CAMLA|nr:hemerythrin family protein [Campylobacter sp. CNRCH_2015_0814]EGK7485089.1 hemerythrin family protein [Campylobacter lari]MCR8698424.1 hemerythrin family protein [Campylobacter sp. LMG 7929]MCR8704685.1 hemerythrin family protein [Campylobacter sp. 2352 PW]MCV3470987.1 hemerythrin family protein [Campylobacter sp. CNRCH_2015_0814]QOQ99964.1 hemerythrin family protein [Campylobacter lari]
MEAFPIWNEKFSIENADIDLQHQTLFALAEKTANLLNRHIYKAEVKELLGDFFDYMRTHFKDEEDYMYSINYPYLSEHKAMHKKIIKDMSVLLSECSSTNDLKEKLYKIVSVWLLEHIVEHDMRISKFKKSLDKKDLNQKQVQESSDKFEYICACKDMIHKLDYGVHIKIKYLNIAYKCKKCSKELVFNYIE